MDDQVPLTILDFSQVSMNCFSYILVAGVVNPWVFIPTIPLAVLMIFVRAYYLASSRDIKRIEAAAKSKPVPKRKAKRRKAKKQKRRVLSAPARSTQ